MDGDGNFEGALQSKALSIADACTQMREMLRRLSDGAAGGAGRCRPEHVLTGVLDICELGTAMRKGAAGRKSAATAGFASMPAIMASIRD